MGKQAPAAPDYTNAAEKQATSSQQSVGAQTQANRPNQTTPWASQQWTQGPDGRWQQSTGFNGALGGLASNLQGQAAQSMASPLDWAQFGQLGTGDDARNQAISAAYNQATSRLDPQWQQRSQLQASQLANQGLDPNSQAYRSQMQQFGQGRNDAYGSAMNSAIAQGTAAGDSAFRNNLASRQQAIAEALRQRGQGLGDLQQLQGFLQMPGFQSAQASDPTQYLNAAIGQGTYGLNAWQAQNQANADAWKGGMQATGGLLDLLKSSGGFALLSDERAKEDIQPTGIDALRGVPFVTWVYKRQYDDSGRRYLGVIAQDLERVAPEYVRTLPDGMKAVDYSFLWERQ